MGWVRAAAKWRSNKTSSKYRNEVVKSARYGIFASKAEYMCHKWLTSLLGAKEGPSIRYFLCQVGIRCLFPKKDDQGNPLMDPLTGLEVLPEKIRYVVDFQVFWLRHPDDMQPREEYIDVKGYRTEAFNLKKKMVESMYPIKLKLLRYDSKRNKFYERH